MDNNTSVFWRDRPTFVTGATGLVGSWLVKKLITAGADLVCLVRDWVPQSELARSHTLEQVRVVRGDIVDQETLERVMNEYEINTVIHLAAQTVVSAAQRNPVLTFKTNIQGTWSLLESCRRSPTVKQIVIASSDKAYGDQGKTAYNENMPLRSQYPYDVSKSCADLIAYTYATTYELPVVISRCGNFYGGGDLNWSRIVPGTIRSIIRGHRPIIRSDGNYVRDYFYVEDAVSAYMLLAERLASQPELRGEAFNFSNETPLITLDLVKHITELMGSNLEPEVQNRVSHEVRYQYLNAAKSRSILGWHPHYSLQEGLQKTILWYREFFTKNNDQR